MRALELIAADVDEPARLCIENVEAWDPEYFTPVLEALPVSRVIDVGHLWLRGEDPRPHVERWLPRTRIVHLHGIAERDHATEAEHQVQMHPTGKRLPGQLAHEHDQPQRGKRERQPLDACRKQREAGAAGGDAWPV